MHIITVTYKNGDTDTLRRAGVADAAAAVQFFNNREDVAAVTLAAPQA